MSVNVPPLSIQKDHFFRFIYLSSFKILCEQALIQTEAGCDIIAPSDMMDGRIRKIRETLENNNYKNTLIMSYTAKYSSSFYGPFRHAVGSSNNFGNKDKSSYQMDYGNSKEAIREAELDISEGADMIMVKPGLPYLDIISKLNQKFDVPIFAYQVSGDCLLYTSPSPRDPE